MRLLLSALLCALVACHGHDHSSYSNYQGCYDEHTNVESLSPLEAIVVCCLDHDIDGLSPACGDTATECEAYLDLNLVSGPGMTEVSTACDEYIRQKDM